jgi:beta-lactamase regulating signal transducer with metallopeptidase domain
MSSWVGPVVSWLGEVYLLSTVILVAAGLAMMASRQPARRLAVARSAMVALVLLAPIAAGTRWARSRSSQRDVVLESLENAVVTCECASGSSPPIAASERPPVDRAGIGLAAFAAGSASMVAWLVLGAIASTRLDGRARAAPDRLRAILARVVGEDRRPPRLIVCSKVPHPVAVGLIRPSIVLPDRFAEAEPDGWIEAALAHEWAHIRNGDLWLLAALRLLLPLLFAHPLYAWLRRRIRDDQEALADAAAAEGRGRIAYAEALLCWARSRGGRAPGTLGPSMSLWGRSPSLAGRVALLLDRDFRVEPTCPRPWRLGVGGVAASAVVGLGVVLMNGPAVATPGMPSVPVAPHVHRLAPSPTEPDSLFCELSCPSDPKSAAAVSRWDGRCASR